MKFWHKIFIGTLIIFILAFDIGVYYLVSYSYNYNREMETDNTIRSQELMRSAISGRIRSTELFYPDVSRNNERLIAIISPLAGYYEQQGVFLSLFNDDRLIYDDISITDNGLLQLENTQSMNVMEMTINGKRHALVASKLPDYPHLTFIYARDISQVDGFRTNISRTFFIINAIVLVFLGFSIYLMLKRMTKPIAELTDTTAEIAGGAYNKRVSISSTDELGTLAHSFNKMAESIAEQMQRITKAADDKQQFIDDLTHEIRTPLTSLLGYSEYLLNAKCTKEEQQLALEHLHNMAERVKNLSDKLIDMTYTSDEYFEWQPVYVPELFDELKSIMIPVLAPRNIKLITSAELTQITGEKMLLLSMLQNLVENAARASNEGAEVTVRVFMDSYPVIEVADTGCGMEQRDIERIMAPFYRVDKSRSRKFGGVGLGMSIVSQIASLHGAKIEIESTINVGTKIKICFTSF